MTPHFRAAHVEELSGKAALMLPLEKAGSDKNGNNEDCAYACDRRLGSHIIGLGRVVDGCF